jgi:hypothetical protein
MFVHEMSPLWLLKSLTLLFSMADVKGATIHTLLTFAAPKQAYLPMK